jgi:hypothetical protein
MAHLTAVGPVTVHNVSLGKLVECPLVSFNKGHSMVVTWSDGSNVTMYFVQDKRLYKAQINGYRIEASNPRFEARV